MKKKQKLIDIVANEYERRKKYIVHSLGGPHMIKRGPLASRYRKMLKEVREHTTMDVSDLAIMLSDYPNTWKIVVTKNRIHVFNPWGPAADPNPRSRGKK